MVFHNKGVNEIIIALDTAVQRFIVEYVIHKLKILTDDLRLKQRHTDPSLSLETSQKSLSCMSKITLRGS